MKKNIHLLKIAVLPIVLLFFAAALNASTGDAKTDSAAIHKVLDNQLAAWNNGDVDGFMQGYWKSDNLKFITKNGVTYGWQNVYNRYKKSYPDKAAMGTLEFEIISIEGLNEKNLHAIGATPQKSGKSYLVVGKWKVSGTVKAAEGYFTLVFKKVNKNWVIISDHTS